MTAAQICIVLAIAVYLIAMVGVGVWFSRTGTASSSDFYLGGRRLGPIVTAMSAEASDMSSYLLMGLPGLAYLCGVAEVGWTVIGLAVGTYLNWLIVAKRLRRYSAATGAITIPDFFSRRYGDRRHILACIAAVIILIFFIPYTASGFKAVGTLFNSLLGVDYHAAMIIGALVIIGYTVLGGFLAVSTTDLIQSVVMSIALLVIILYGIQAAGGWEAVVSNAASLPGYLSLTQGYAPASGSAGTYGFLSIVSTLAWGLGYFGMPHILLRFMAIEDEEKLAVSRRIASVWVVISMFVAIVIGIVGYSVSVSGKIPFLTTSAESETIVIALSNLMSGSGILLALTAGVILAGILAATMSTADSQLLTAASSVSQNLLEEFFGVKLSKKASMLAARGTVAAIAVIAVVLAWNPDSSVFRVVSFAWAGFGGAFGPVMLFALFWRRSNLQGALAGMVAGGVTVFVWKFAIAPLGGAWAVYELLPAFLVGCAAIVAVSLLTAAPPKEITDTYDRVGQK
ncbi:MAG: sodium/proline symporter [Oscillibacter sp.]|nr:sodium/proline symporter [Oscillibacter sp.]